MCRKISCFLLVVVWIVAIVGLAKPAFAANMDLKKQEEGTLNIFVPMIRLAYMPPTPILNSIENGDLDNSYKITWQSLQELDTPTANVSITIEEATTANFTDKTVYQVAGSEIESEWSPTSDVGKLPGTYYYQMNVSVGPLTGEWSNTESVTIYPLFVGLKVRWDSVGYLRGSRHEDVGYRYEWNADNLTEGDTIRVKASVRYSPNPQDFPNEDFDLFYSATTGFFRTSDSPGDPTWKWGKPQFLSYDLELTNKQTISIDNQKFEVSGPLSGYTTYGKSIEYWELVNVEKFLFYENGKFKQYVNKGDAVLRYHTGSSRLLIYSSVRRQFYYDGDNTGDTVQYIEQLSSSTALEGGDVFVQRMDIIDDTNEGDTNYPPNEESPIRPMNPNR